MERRDFLASLLVVPFLTSDNSPIRAVRVAKLFKSPDGHPNALETTAEGLWVGEQTTDRAYLMDWEGKVLRHVETESSNTSGIAFGGGFLWMAANGEALGRAPKSTDAATGEILKVDPSTGKTIARYPVPGGGGVHGLEFADGTLWITSLKLRKLSQVDPKDFRLIHQIPVHLDRAHGLAWDNGAIWCLHTSDRVIHKLDAKDGRILEKITLAKEDPDPHGMCLYRDHLYYCDAGIAPGGISNESPSAGYVCRIDPS
jgi:sugar lactone lactonase YvrE